MYFRRSRQRILPKPLSAINPIDWAFTMRDLPDLISKKTWFLAFNLVAIIYLVASGSLRWNVLSIVSYGFALLVMNIVAWISARKYKGWK